MTAATEGRGNEERAREISDARPVCTCTDRACRMTERFDLLVAAALDAAEDRGFRRGVEEAAKHVAFHQCRSAPRLRDMIRALAGGGKPNPSSGPAS